MHLMGSLYMITLLGRIDGLSLEEGMPPCPPGHKLWFDIFKHTINCLFQYIFQSVRQSMPVLLFYLTAYRIFEVLFKDATTETDCIRGMDNGWSMSRSKFASNM